MADPKALTERLWAIRSPPTGLAPYAALAPRPRRGSLREISTCMATLFFSYSHKDEALRDELEVHLANLKRQGLIDAWHDRRILAGDELNGAIDSKLNSADIILALLSPDFLASRYCYDIEMKRALERQREKECRVIAVILRPCDWQATPFSELLVTPTDGKPVTRWPDRDEAFLDVIRQIRESLPKRSVRSVPPESMLSAQAPKLAPARSSNLRLRKEFSEADRHRFLDDAFDFIGRFFEESLAELQRRNQGIEGRFRRIDTQAFGAIVYRNGSVVAKCGIRNGGLSGFGDGITFTDDPTAPKNSMSESPSNRFGRAVTISEARRDGDVSRTKCRLSPIPGRGCGVPLVASHGASSAVSEPMPIN